MPIKFSKYQIATAIAILFHTIGLVGILIFKSDFIIRATPVNLLLMFALLIWTQAQKNIAFWLFIASIVLLGILVEMIGVNTQLLFGSYSYSNVLGPQINNVPFIIGINWFVIIYCCGIAIHTILMKAIYKVSKETATPPMILKAISVIIDGATVAVFFDWIMEPVAVQLKFWKWDGDIPFYNYICWLLVSAAMLSLFHFFKFSKHNKFAIHLLLIQLMFFLLLRTFLYA